MSKYICNGCARTYDSDLHDSVEVNDELHCPDCAINVTTECSHCTATFETYRHDGDIETDYCYICMMDNEIQMDMDGQMGG